MLCHQSLLLGQFPGVRVLRSFAFTDPRYDVVFARTSIVLCVIIASVFL